MIKEILSTDRLKNAKKIKKNFPPIKEIFQSLGYFNFHHCQIFTLRLHSHYQIYDTLLSEVAIFIIAELHFSNTTLNLMGSGWGSLIGGGKNGNVAFMAYSTDSCNHTNPVSSNWKIMIYKLPVSIVLRPGNPSTVSIIY